MTIKLDADKVSAIFRDCLLTEQEMENMEEVNSSAITVSGITMKVGFHPKRIEENSALIKEYLQELPEPFFEKTGGGWSFINACMDKNGVQWGEQRNAQELMLLGMAIKKVEFLLPRELWVACPGGMPYFVVKE